MVGTIINSIDPALYFGFNLVLFNNETSPVLANGIGMGNSTDGTVPTSLDLLNLKQSVLDDFDQCFTWDGLNLRSQYQYISGPPLRCPSTMPPSTTPPSTTSPSTTSPSTTFPSTTFPSTTSPVTTISSTLSPPTTTSTTNIPSTFTPSTLSPFNCLYSVLNCQNCGNKGIVVDQSLFNIKCVSIGNEWSYSFENKSSSTVEFNNLITLNRTNLVIEGNFNQSKDSTIVVVLDQDRNSSIYSSGCVSLDGNIILVIENQPPNGTEVYQLFSYNCSQTLSVSDSQITLSTNYKDSKCDNIVSSLNNNPNSLSVSVSSTLRSNCKGKI